MKINQLFLYNFGIYAGENILTLENEKPVVLIGGMNGRGKTSILEAVLLALYGENSFAYLESSYNSYAKYLRAYVNENDGSLESSVELTFTMDDGVRYSVRRSWSAKTLRTNEQIYVIKDGQPDTFLAQNWSMFIEEVLPSGLSNFFFFDGEKIAEMADDSSDLKMKESIKALLGISVLDVLEKDLNRLSSKHKPKEDDQERGHFEYLKSQKQETDKKLAKIDDKIRRLEGTCDSARKKISQLQAEYTIKGGDVIQQRQALFEEKTELLVECTMLQGMLIEAAAGELPFLLVPDLLQKIRTQSENENQNKSLEITAKGIDELYQSFAKEKGGDFNALDDFIAFIKSQSQGKKCDMVFDLSDHALYQLQVLQDIRLNQTKKKVLEKRQKLQKYRERVEEIEHYLALDIDEEALNSIQEKIEKEQEKLFRKEVSLAQAQDIRTLVNRLAQKQAAELKDYVEKYLNQVEMQDDDKRIAKYTHLALDVLSNYKVKLQAKKIDVLGKTMAQCFDQLSNKHNLIHSIAIDEQSLDIHYFREDGKELTKNMLSAGENQLLVISLLWALTICSKKKLPIIIDTPLSRLDSLHRALLVANYFPFVGEQTIILSTDSEVDENYYSLLKPHIGDEFTLIYHEDEKRTSIAEGYFAEDAL